ncbi:MAG: phosphoribosylglycinamide formyltransferase [Abditibacteriales bacterium]|nr:phosphoribosylglycinamide formyltransferase [Abditibacteriales bacterium]
MNDSIRLGVLVSGRGRGTNLQAILDACARGETKAQVVVVISTHPEAGAVERARRHNVEALIIDPKQFAAPEDYERELTQRLRERQVDLVCLAGYMRKLSPLFVDAWRNRILNIHPALLPAFGGQGMYGHHVHEAVIESGAKFSGATVHFVDEEYDHGPIVLQAVVPVFDDDTPDTLAARVLEQEHKLYPQAKGRLHIEGRRVKIKGASPNCPH